MAVPTITSIDPTAGSSKGTNLVKIYGTNFSIATPPTAEGYHGGPEQQTVSVKFEGVEADWAGAASDTLIFCRASRWSGSYDALPINADVRVANLDANGVEVPGENATLLDAYTIDRPQIIGSTVQSLCEELIALFRRLFLENTHITMSRYFVEDTAFLDRVRAEVPVVYLVGPSLSRDGLRTRYRREAYEDPLDSLRYEQKAPPVYVVMNFDVRCYADNSQHAMGMQQQLALLFRDVGYFSFQGRDLEFRMPFNQYPSVINVPNQSDLQSVRCGLSIRGVQVDDETGTMVERGTIVFENDGDPIIELQGL